MPARAIPAAMPARMSGMVIDVVPGGPVSR